MPDAVASKKPENPFSRTSWAGVAWYAVGSRSWWACVAALACNQVATMVLNQTVHPLYDTVFSLSKDIATLWAALAAIVLYLLVARHPGWVRPRTFAWVGVAASVGGSILAVAFSTAAPSAAVLTVAACLRTSGNIWVSAMVYLALVNQALGHGTRAALAAVCSGWGLSYLLEGLALGLPPNVQLVVFVVMPAVVCTLAYGGSRPVIELTQTAPAADDLRVTNPASFISLGNTVFVAFVLLKMSFGFAMTFLSSDGTPVVTVLACVPALLVATALALATKPDRGLNAFYRATMLLVLAGFLLVNPLISQMTGMPTLANLVLRAGSDLARMFALLVVAFLGMRNPMNALCVALFVGAANSVGSVVGAQLGLAANAALTHDPGMFALLLAAVVLAFVAYNVVTPQNFDFDRTARSIEPVEPVQPVERADRLTLACERLAAEHGLTPREAETLELLAHGRNTAAIQERMVVSRSTAKTHIRNAYAKLGVHAQQDLIDLVEKKVG